MPTVTVAMVESEFPSGSSGFAASYVQTKIGRASRMFGAVKSHANWSDAVSLQVAHWLYMKKNSVGGQGNPDDPQVLGPIKRAKLRGKEFEFDSLPDPDFGNLPPGSEDLWQSPYGRELIPILQTFPPAAFSGYGRPPLL